MCQSFKIDSLKALLRDRNVDQRSRLLWDICYEYADVNNREALKYGKLAFLLATTSCDSTMMVKAARLMAYCYRNLEYMDSSNAISMKVLPMAERFGGDEERIKLLIGLGLGNTWTGDYVSALQYNFEAYERAEIFDFVNFNIQILNNIGLIYYKLENHPRALDYFRAAVHFPAIGKSEIHRRATAFLNMSLCYTHLSLFDSAKFAIRDAVSANPMIDENDLEYLHCVAALYQAKHDYVKARWYYEKAFRKAQEVGSIRHQLDCVICLLHIAIDEKERRKCIEYFREVEDLLRQCPYGNHLMATYQQLASVYKKDRNLIKFAYYQTKYIEVKDSIYNKRYVNEMIEVENGFLTRSKNKSIAEKEDRLVLKEAIIERQLYFNLMIAAIAIMLAAFLLLAYKSYRRGKMMNSVLDAKIRQRTKELERVNGALKQALEYEDIKHQRISVEVGKVVTSIRVLCEIARNDIDKGSYLNQIESAIRSLDEDASSNI